MTKLDEKMIIFKKKILEENIYDKKKMWWKN